MNDRPLSETEIKIIVDLIKILFGPGFSNKKKTQIKSNEYFGRHFEKNKNKTKTKQINNKNIFTTKIIIQ